MCVYVCVCLCIAASHTALLSPHCFFVLCLVPVAPPVIEMQAPKRMILTLNESLSLTCNTSNVNGDIKLKWVTPPGSVRPLCLLFAVSALLVAGSVRACCTLCICCRCCFVRLETLYLFRLERVKKRFRFSSFLSQNQCCFLCSCSDFTVLLLFCYFDSFQNNWLCTCVSGFTD